jgi:2-polyprenyl-6-methoxyphenol hydroxylase-like FAD-dependent oxidoreductase
MTRSAIIIGGGIAGPLTAIGLKKAGVEATVYEAYEEPAYETGAWLTVAVNGIQALRTLGLHDAVKAAGFPAERITFANGTGKHLGTVPLGGKLADGSVTHTLKRGELLRVIHEAAREQHVPIVYGKQLLAAAQNERGVTARFKDGSEAHADVLIGADGVHSQLRRIIDPQAPRATYSRLLNFGSFVPPGRVKLAPGEYGMVFATRGFFGYVVAPSGEVWWFANVPSERELGREELATTDWRARLLEVFRGDAGPMCALIEATPGQIDAINTYDVEMVPRWHHGKLVILGDAAHAASPATGQGASMAAEDAVVLAKCMRDYAAVEPALEAFVTERRARTERVVAEGKRYANMKLVGPVGRFFRDLMLPMILRRQARPSHAGARAWLFEHQIEWNA